MDSAKPLLYPRYPPFLPLNPQIITENTFSLLYLFCQISSFSIPALWRNYRTYLVFAEFWIITGSLWGFRLGVFEMKLNLSPFFSFYVYLTELKISLFFFVKQMNPMTKDCKRHYWAVQVHMTQRTVFIVFICFIFCMYVSFNLVRNLSVKYRTWYYISQYNVSAGQQYELKCTFDQGNGDDDKACHKTILTCPCTHLKIYINTSSLLAMKRSPHNAILI